MLNYLHQPQTPKQSQVMSYNTPTGSSARHGWRPSAAKSPAVNLVCRGLFYVLLRSNPSQDLLKHSTGAPSVPFLDRARRNGLLAPHGTLEYLTCRDLRLRQFAAARRWLPRPVCLTLNTTSLSTNKGLKHHPRDSLNGPPSCKPAETCAPGLRHRHCPLSAPPGSSSSLAPQYPTSWSIARCTLAWARRVPKISLRHEWSDLFDHDLGEKTICRLRL
ncbi:uncharacterized protein LY79DRAFT_100676 [Colletotrichum navitas]|uniref:Uncharacterized protein n=1 Tax=Colletotrichum navitas TaxID=681940 RepID=A0AAD8V5Z5_9PEZI|nr:uncharacterized protein LY79DRAFT_100676 [Colletotrichum navitas]KAK1595517.1 hypothetical protein LY79DRAFT_100676 [Colletotrichum navitas]